MATRYYYHRILPTSYSRKKLPVRNGPKDLLLTLHRPLLVGDGVYRCQKRQDDDGGCEGSMLLVK
jgi:hypothetical protein